MLYLNGEPVPITLFPDHTSQVWKVPNLPDKSTEFQPRFAEVRWEFEHEGEFMHLAQLLDLLKQQNIRARLRLTYLPYGRQDKVVSNTATFALHTFAKLLNSLHPYEVTIDDPHSDIALSLINNSSAVYPVKMVEKVAQEIKGDLVLCYPDKGAREKYTKEYETLYRPHIYGEKVRDQLTGNILSYKVVGECAGKDVLILDDICDGGMTFKLLAKDLLATGAKSVVLFVTHGIFSKGLQTLKDSGIQRIFTQDGEASEEAGQIIYRKL